MATDASAVLDALYAGDLGVARTRAGGDDAVVRAFAPLVASEAPVAPGEAPAALQPFVDLALAHQHLGSLGSTAAPRPDGSDRWSAAARALLAFIGGGSVPLPEGRAAQPALRVEEMALRALAALAAGDDAGATQAARQASRAAYAESMRLQEYFAYWVLGRVRRATGSLYAAARIAGALCRSAPSLWHPLFDWELVLAGVGEDGAGRPLSEPAGSWRRLCEAAEAGDAVAWERERAVLAGAVLPPVFAAERDALLAGIDPGAEATLERLRPVAGALHDSAARLGQTPAVWSVEPGREPRLRWCVAEPVAPERAHLFDQGERIQGLAGALSEGGGAGLPVAEAFRRVYGFAMDPAVHDGIFRVLLHRVRGALEGAARVERSGDVLRLVPDKALILPEPRSQAPFGDRILRLIAASPGKTAKELASEAGTTVRGVQRTLRLLLDTGACRAERVGRRTVYAVEDTTFSEPTNFGAAR
ncbi:MAG: helix-turn-helix domain-containing protein [Myxococcota bacterium]